MFSSFSSCNDATFGLSSFNRSRKMAPFFMGGIVSEGLVSAKRKDDDTGCGGSVTGAIKAGEKEEEEEAEEKEAEEEDVGGDTDRSTVVEGTAVSRLGRCMKGMRGGSGARGGPVVGCAKVCRRIGVALFVGVAVGMAVGGAMADGGVACL